MRISRRISQHSSGSDSLQGPHYPIICLSVRVWMTFLARLTSCRRYDRVPLPVLILVNNILAEYTQTSQAQTRRLCEYGCQDPSRCRYCLLVLGAAVLLTRYALREESWPHFDRISVSFASFDVSGGSYSPLWYPKSVY